MIPETKYCKLCDKQLPLESFRPRCRRLLCREHLRAMARQYLQRVYNNPERTASTRLWDCCYRDCAAFGYSKVNLTLKDILRFFEGRNLTDYAKVCLVPLDPTQPLSADNATLVDRKCRPHLIGIWKQTRNVPQYIELVKILASTVA